MNRAYDYEEEQYEEGLTWKKVGHFFAKGWVRMITYAAVCAVLALTVGLLFREFYKTEPIAQTSLEFVYNGIEKGKAPDGSTFTSDSIISTTVLSDAITASGLSGKFKDVSSLRDKMRVENVLSEEYSQLLEAAASGDKTATDRLLTYKFYPTQFKVILSRPADLDLSDAQATQLLNNVVTSYYADFAKRYSVSNMFSAEMYTLSQNEMIEFTDAFDMYTDSFLSVKESLTALQKEDPTFVSAENNTTFTQLLGELNILTSNYNLFNAKILSANVWRNPEQAESSLIAARTDIENNVKPLQDYITALTKQLEQMEPIKKWTDKDANGNETVLAEYPADYYVFQTKLDESNRQLRDYQVRLANIETRMAALKSESITDNAEAVTGAVADLAKLEQETTAFINKVNATINDYYAKSISSAVRQTEPASVTRVRADFNVWLVVGAAAVFGLLVACIVTIAKIVRANNAKRVPQPAAEQAQTDSADNNGEEKKEKSEKAEKK